MIKKECNLETEVLVNLDHSSTPFYMFQMVTEMIELLEIIVTETNRYATQKGHNFETRDDEMESFHGINFMIGVNELPSWGGFCSTGKFIVNEKIRNVVISPSKSVLLLNIL